MRVLVLGGYGNFGARICRALSADENINLIVAGRDQKRAQDFARTLPKPALAIALDSNEQALAQRFTELNVGLVIHSAGPFQGQDYRVAHAAASAHCHYLDLSDSRRFVCDFPAAMNAAFNAANKLALTGVSTVPTLSSAVVDELSRGWQRIDHIECCIAPAQTAPRGTATMAAVLSYCGAPIQVWREGRWHTDYGWQKLQRVHFSRLKPRLGALCDIPDLELFPPHYPSVKTVQFLAALELSASQCALAVLAFLRRMGLIRHPERWANTINTTAQTLDIFGSALGGMVVTIKGANGEGESVTAAWHIAADGDHGPEIPCMAAIILARKLANNEIARIGAYCAISCLQLAEFQDEFARWGMLTDINVVDTAAPRQLEIPS